MSALKLIRRDQPLEPGRVLAFTFTVRYLVPLDEDSLPDGPEPLEAVEDWLSGGKGDDSERLWTSIQSHYARDMVEHEVTLADTGEGDRFELRWEAREREQGRAGTWQSREWLDEVPSAEPSAWVEGAPKVTPDGGALQ